MNFVTSDDLQESLTVYITHMPHTLRLLSSSQNLCLIIIISMRTGPLPSQLTYSVILAGEGSGVGMGGGGDVLSHSMSVSTDLRHSPMLLSW